MFRQKSRIQQIKEEYEKQRQEHGDDSELLIPAMELWRLFVEGKAQRSNKGIAAYFRDDIPNVSIREYAESESGGGEWLNAPFIDFLSARFWQPTAALCDMNLPDFVALDQAWLQYENEAGYLASLYAVYPLLFDFSAPLDAGLIKKLHQHALAGVDGTSYLDDQSEPPGAFRTSYNCGMVLFEGNFSEKGLQEWLNREARKTGKSQHHLYYTVCVYTPENELMGVINLDCWAVTLLREYVDLKEQKLASGQKELLIDQYDLSYEAWKSFVIACCIPSRSHENEFVTFLSQNQAFDKILSAIGETKNNAELARCLFELANRFNLERQSIRMSQEQKSYSYDVMFNSEQISEKIAVPDLLQVEVDRLLAQFKKDVQRANSNLQLVLAEIIGLIQDLHQLHPFLDGNGRTFCILLFNHLLVRYGFPPCMIDNTAIFSLCSREEILDHVLEGMEQTLRINKKRDYPGPSTQQVLADLARHPGLHAYLAEFQVLVQAEEQRRAKKWIHLKPQT